MTVMMSAHLITPVHSLFHTNWRDLFLFFAEKFCFIRDLCMWGNIVHLDWLS